MHFEVFNRRLLGRHDIVAVDMIQYSGLWGVCFSHHQPHNNHPRYADDTTTAGVLRFLASESLAPLSNYTITTHHVDADSVFARLVAFKPQLALEQRDLLERVARCGDFFIYIDDESAQLNFIVESLHQQLRAEGQRGERLIHEELNRRCFDWLLPRWQAFLANPASGSDLWQQPMRDMLADMAYLSAPGRVTELWDCHTSLVEADHEPDAYALNSMCRNDLLLVWRSDTPQRMLDVRPAIGWYDLRSLPHHPSYPLADLAARLNAAEQAAGHAALWHYKPGPVWLRADASCLSQQAVITVMREWLSAASEQALPAAYRADVQQVFSRLPRHATYSSHERFAQADALHYAPHAPYGGLHLVPRSDAPQAEHRLQGAAHERPLVMSERPLQFAVSDDFYWNRRDPQPLELHVTYRDDSRGSFHVEYDSWHDPFHPTAPVALAGDGEQHTALFRIDEGRLGNSQDWGDLRIVPTKGTSLAISELRLRKL